MSRPIDAEWAVRALRAAQEIADAIGGAVELDRVLELIVERGAALVEARSVLILLREGDQLVLAASSCHATAALGRGLPIQRSIAGRVLRGGQPRLVAGVEGVVEPVGTELGVPGARAVLLIPMFHRDTGIGVLAAVDGLAAEGSFRPADEQLLRTFAACASNAVAIKRRAAAPRLHATIGAAEAERRRWARDLHDQTLQALGALRLLLSSAARRGDPEGNVAAIRQALEDLEAETENLRGIITDLRPSMLDDLGLKPALEALIERRREAGIQIDCEIQVPGRAVGGAAADQELSTTVYRLVQESVTNVVKHARASTCRVTVDSDSEEIRVEVVDDGRGYDTSAQPSGFGLAGMRERVYLAGGTLEVDSSDRGTAVRARLPLDGFGSVAPGLRRT